jgi:hypothetical protein
MKKWILVFAAAVSLIGGLSPAFAQAATKDAVYIIFDASGSMKKNLPDRTIRIDVAKKVVQDFVASSDFKGYDLALRIYGHRRKGDCLDSQMVVPFDSPEVVVPKVKNFMKNIMPLGSTPITYSLKEALKDMGDRRGEIILVTDGIETCNEDPCELVRNWKNSNVKMRVHVVGFGLDEKSKEAIRCISEAAGTPFYDAQSASSLAQSLNKIQEEVIAVKPIVQTPPPPPVTPLEFFIEGVDPQGNRVNVKGSLLKDGEEIQKVESYQRYTDIKPGDYTVSVGMETINGNIYKPVSKDVKISESGRTTVVVEVPLPPSVIGRFVDFDQTQSQGFIRAHQNGQELFKFQAGQKVYLDEGAYEFKAQPNIHNEFSKTESFAAGDHKEIIFEMIQEVHFKAKVVSKQGVEFHKYTYELWQNGQRKYDIRSVNGAKVLPGIYDLKVVWVLGSYTYPGLEITKAPTQKRDIPVPTGHATFVYQTFDGSPDKADRVFVSANPGKQQLFHNSNQKYPFLPGAYQVEGWKNKKGRAYEAVKFEIKEGEDKQVVLRSKI